MALQVLGEIKHLKITGILRVKQTGHTRAIEVVCTDSGQQVTCIVKPYGNLPLKTQTSARELIGSILAHAFGLRVPTPYFIDIDINAWELTDDLEIKDRIRNSIGLNFGCKYLDSGTFPANYVDKAFLEQAGDIFAFDMLTQNDDRRTGNANMLQDPDGFILYDHEMAFPYSRPDMFLGRFPAPWEFTEPGFMNYRQHFFYEKIRKQRLEFAKFHDSLVELNNVLPAIIIDRLPQEWLGKEIYSIIDYLKNASVNADEFGKALRMVLQ